VFLTAFDFGSYFARKNPLAVVAAFRQAFGQRPQRGQSGDRRPMLVVKTVSSGPHQLDFGELLLAIGGQANIRIIDQVLGRDDMLALLRQSDAYVQLHRSEGFGLLMAEAMALGKPVIATAYSANVDYMNPANSLPVDFRLVELDRDHGPYRRGAVWAEPDVAHAAALMRCLVNDRDLGRRLGQQARQDIARQLSPARIGAMIRDRLTVIENQGTENPGTPGQ
jgi:glycosyltransferase involved in cell wall biosynthesis